MSNLNTRDNVAFSNISATTATFTLKGGRYGITCVGTSFGTVTLQKLGPDGTNYVTAATAFAANGYIVSDLPNGTYRVAVSTTTAVYVDIQSIAVPLA